MELNKIRLDMEERLQEDVMLDYHIKLLYDYTQFNHYQSIDVMSKIIEVINNIINKRLARKVK